MATLQHRRSDQALDHGREHLWRPGSFLITLTAAALVLIVIWPFLCILGQSLNRIDVPMNPLWPLPPQFSTRICELMVTKYHFDRYLWNTLKVTFTATALTILASALAAYALAKYEFRGRRLLFLIVLGIMLLPGDVMFVPRFEVMRQLKMVNNYWGLILPAVGGNAFGIFLMRQFLQAVPTEMIEAARIDGASEIGAFFWVVLPNMLAPLGVLATLSLQNNWNALLWPQVLITDEAKMLIMPAIARLSTVTLNDPYGFPAVIAASMTAAILPLLLFGYSQRYFVATLSGAIKG